MSYKKKPTRAEVINNLILMGNSNPKIYKLIKTFELVDELGNNQINSLTIKKQKQMAKTENKPSKFKNEVESVDFEKIPFLKFEDEGESIEGDYIGFNTIDFKNGKGDQNVHKIVIDGITHYLPSNAQLNNKMSALAKQLNESGADSIEVQITFTGWKKLEAGKKAKEFRVLTA